MSSRAWTPPLSSTKLGTRIRNRWSEGSGRESFPCQYVCGECGWLADRSDDACPACDSESWIDVAHVNTAVALRTNERDNPTLDDGQERLAKVASALVFTVFAGAGVALSLATLPVIGSVVAVVGGGMLARNALAPIRDALHRRVTRTLPARRRLALPPAQGLVGRLRGVALTTSQLRSLLDDRPVLAWRVRARLVTESHEQLVIDDARSVAFELAGRRFEADSVQLSAAVRTVHVADLDDDARERVARFLRERGCFSHEGDWIIEQEVVELGRPIELEGRGDSEAPVVRLDSEAASSPYR